MNGPQRPLACVIIPAHNHARFLPEAIESALCQTYRPIEVVVVDDGSTDETAEVVAACPEVRYVRQARQGSAAARNRGLAATAGEFVTCLDADDRLLPEALALGVDYLRSHPGCALVSGHVRIIDEDGAAAGVPPQDHADASYLALLRSNHIWTPGAVTYRRDAFDRDHPFDPKAEGSADYELNIRLARQFDIGCHHQIVLEYRRHPSNMSAGAAYMLESAVRVRRGQREHVGGDPAARAALKAGIAAVQADFGARVVEQVVADLRAVRVGGALRGLWTLARFHPRGLLALARRALARWGTAPELQTKPGRGARKSRSETG